MSVATLAVLSVLTGVQVAALVFLIGIGSHLRSVAETVRRLKP